MTIKRNKAFLLIEVLVTIVVISVSIIFINRAFSSSLRAIGLTKDYLAAIGALQEKMFEVDLYGAQDTEDLTGEIEFLGKSFQCSHEVLPIKEQREEFADEEAGLGIKELQVSLSWQRQGIKRNIDILTYIRQAEELEE